MPVLHCPELVRARGVLLHVLGVRVLVMPRLKLEHG